MRKRSSFVRRLVRNGRVKVYGSWYRPDEQFQPYKGEMDGLYYWFSLYGDEYPTIVMWGNESQHDGPIGEYGPELVKDGSLPWTWWRRIDESV